MTTVYNGASGAEEIKTGCSRLSYFYVFFYFLFLFFVFDRSSQQNSLFYIRSILFDEVAEEAFFFLAGKGEDHTSFRVMSFLFQLRALGLFEI